MSDDLDRKAAPRVVVGLDGSDHSKDALRWAARYAGLTAAVIRAVAVWDFPATVGWVSMPTDWDPQSDTRKMLESTVDDVLGRDRPSDLELVVGEGGAASILLEQSEGAALLVVGSRGHGGFVGLLLGSVSASVAEHARCPVVVVHGEHPSGTDPASVSA